MSKPVSTALEKITNGAVIILFGTIVSSVLTFLTRILIVRQLFPAEYGVFSIIVAIISIAAAIGSLGIFSSIPRFIAYYRTNSDPARVLGTIKASLEISLAGGVIVWAFVFFGANKLSMLFHNPNLVLSLRIYSFAIPFLILLQNFIAVFRGFNRVSIKSVFEDGILPGLIFAGVGLLSITAFSLNKLLFAELFAVIITVIMLAGYSCKKYFLFARKHISFSVRNALIIFSLPLILNIFLRRIIEWSDILMIGYFMKNADVGIYNAAFPLARFLPTFLASAVFLYIPLATQFFASGQMDYLKKNYVVITKWIFAVTLPFFLILFLFPNVILTFLYGAEYRAASIVLMVLSFGFMFHAFLGPNHATLLVIGKTKSLLFANLVAVIFNLLLNLILIPTQGILGAGISSAASLIISNLIITILLYKFTKIHPFTKKYIKPILVSLFLVAVLYYLTKVLLTITIWMLPLLFALFNVLYVLALLLTKSFDKEDIRLLLSIEKKTGLNLQFIKNSFKKILKLHK